MIKNFEQFKNDTVEEGLFSAFKTRNQIMKLQSMVVDKYEELLKENPENFHDGQSVMNAVENVVNSLDGDERTGAMIVLKALTAPMKQIADNAGLDGAVIISKIRDMDKVGYGFDAYNEKYCDMLEAGIVDPVKVTRSALQNAASIASTVLTTESVVSDKKEETPAPMAAPGGMGGGMGGMY